MIGRLKGQGDLWLFIVFLSPFPFRIWTTEYRELFHAEFVRCEWMARDGRTDRFMILRLSLSSLPPFFQDEEYLFNSSRFTFLPSYFLRSFHRGYFLFPWLPFFHGMM